MVAGYTKHSCYRELNVKYDPSAALKFHYEYVSLCDLVAFDAAKQEVLTYEDHGIPEQEGYDDKS